jgi:hypothetical protein
MPVSSCLVTSVAVMSTLVALHAPYYELSWRAEARSVGAALTEKETRAGTGRVSCGIRTGNTRDEDVNSQPDGATKP